MTKKIGISLPEDLYKQAIKYKESIGATFSGLVKTSLQEKLKSKNGS